MSTSKIINKTNALTPEQKKSSQILLRAHNPVSEIEYVVKTVQIVLHNAFPSLKRRNFSREKG